MPRMLLAREQMKQPCSLGFCFLPYESGSVGLLRQTGLTRGERVPAGPGEAGVKGEHRGEKALSCGQGMGTIDGQSLNH